MTRIGADPDDLAGLSRKLDSLGTQLERSGNSIDAALRRATWNGRDAEDFRMQWSREHRPHIGRAVTTCGRLARELDRQAGEQESASGDTGRSSGGPAIIVGDVTHPKGPHPVGSTSTSTSDAEPSLAIGNGDFGPVLSGIGPNEPHRGITRVLPPDEVLTLGVGLEATVLAGLVVGGHRATIESRGERRLVTIGTRDAVGVRGSFGGSIALGPIRADLSARGDALLGVVTRKSFETDRSGTAMTVLGAELDGVRGRLSAIGKHIPLPTAAIVGPISDAIDVVGRTLGLFPEPARTETLAEIAVTGSAAAMAPMGIGGGRLIDRVARVGISQGVSGDFYVVEVEGTLADSVSASHTRSAGSKGSVVDKGSTPGAGERTAPTGGNRIETRTTASDRTFLTRVEIHTDGDRPMAIVQTDTTDGSVLERTTTLVTPRPLSDPAMSRGLLAGIADIRAGRVDDALARLTNLGLTEPDGPSIRATYALSTTDGAVGGSAGEGLGLGGFVSAEGVRMVRVSDR